MALPKKGAQQRRVGVCPVAAALSALTTAGPAVASANVGGEVFAFASPAGVQERCVILARMPGAVYRESDVAE